MTRLLLFTLGAALTFYSATVAYDVQGALYTRAISLAIVAAAASLVWFALMNYRLDNISQMLLYALLWDSMVTLVFLFVPLVLHGARLSLLQAVGVSLTCVGLLICRS